MQKIVANCRISGEIRERVQGIQRGHVLRYVTSLWTITTRTLEAHLFPDGYHIYQDCTKFNYDITLARTNLLINKNDRYALKVCYPSSSSAYTPPHKRHLTPDPIVTTPIFPIISLSPRARARIHSPRAQRLQLYESHATPKYYACYTKYSTPGQTPTNQMLAPIGSSWETAWDAFQEFFQLKTGMKWEERFVRMEMMGEAFTYTPPKVGQPRGMFLEI